MNFSKTLLTVVFCSALLLPSYTRPSSSADNFAYYACATVLGLAGAVAGAKVAEWYFTETNSQLIARAESEYIRAFEYSDILLTFERLYGVNNPNSWRQDDIIKNISEPILYELALAVWHKNISQVSYMSDVAYATRELASLSSRLYQRIASMEGRYLYNNEIMELNAMRSVLVKIDSLLPRLSLLSRYYASHNSYFLLYDKEAQLYKDYDLQIRIARSGNYYNVITYDICQSVLSYNGRYPFVTFVHDIADDVSALKRAINNLPVYYKDRLRVAQELEQTLDFVKKTVIADPRYRTELDYKEKEYLERMRLAEIQRANDIEERNIEEKREQNRILREQNKILQEAERRAYQSDHAHEHGVTTPVECNVNLAVGVGLVYTP